MDNLSCSGPAYQTIELYDSKESKTCIRPSRPAGDTIRRSLTPTRITQPSPRPWTATVTSETNLYENAYAEEEKNVCQNFCEKEVCQRERVCQREGSTKGTECQRESRIVRRETSCERPMPAPQGHHHEEQHSHTEEDICRSEGNIHRHEHKTSNVCKFICEPEPSQTCRPPPCPPQPIEETKEPETIDLSKIVPPDVAVCPKGVDAEHDYYTETEEKDEDGLHIKKTTVYEKTVELVSPDKEIEAHFNQNKNDGREAPRDECIRRCSTADREVAAISSRRNLSATSESLAAKIETQKMIEETKKQEEEERRRRQQEERMMRQEEQRRIQEEEAKMQELKRRDSLQKRQRDLEAQQREAEDRRRLEQEESERSGKRVSFSEQRRGSQQSNSEQRRGSQQQCINCPQQSQNQNEHIINVDLECDRPPSREHIIKVEIEGDTPKTQVNEVSAEYTVKRTCNKNQIEEERRRSIREQVQVHQSLRQQIPEKRQSLQERRLCSRFQKQSQSCESQSSSTACSKKHVQFVQKSSNETCPMQQSKVQNSAPKEWQSEMCKALTTAPECSYQMQTGSGSMCEKQECTREIVMESTCSRCQPQRPISPFVEALTTAPDRPYSPLGQEAKCTCQCFRPETPSMEETNGYCAPAQILYTETRRESRPKKPEGPRPLPTPPPDYRFRDSSSSPCRFRPPTPSDRPSSGLGLKRPDSIPMYQKYLVAEEHQPVQGHDYAPCSSPCLAKSPAPEPSEPSDCYLKNQASCARNIQQQVPDKTEIKRYHYEEDTPQMHKSKDTITTQNISYVGKGASRHAHHQDHEDTITEECDGHHHVKKIQHRLKEYDTDEEPPCDPQPCATCPLNKTGPTPTLPCPTASANVSPRFPKTGVRVLPPMGPPEVRRIRHEVPSPPPCPKTGVTVLPCKAHSDTVCKTGVVVVPCDGIGTGGVCITPTPDRSGLCISPCPAQSGGICKKPSCYCGSTSGRCTTPNQNKNNDKNSGNNSNSYGGSGVCIKPMGNNSYSVSPCPIAGSSVQGVRSVQCPKPILKNISPCKAKIPFPQIPLPDEESNQNCASCPIASAAPCSFKSNSESRDNGFQPIHKPRTNLSNQITTLTLCKRDNKPVPTVQLYKPEPPPSTCSINKTTTCTTKTIQNQSTKFRQETQSYTTNQNQSQPQSLPSQCPFSNTQKLDDPPNLSSRPDLGAGVGGYGGNRGGTCAGSSAPNRGRGILNQAGGPGLRVPLCAACNSQVRGPFISALGQIWCPEHFVCVNTQCRRSLQDIGFVEEKGQLYCEYCFEKFIAPSCDKCNQKIKGDCLNAIGKHFHPECFCCAHCGKRFGNSPFFLEEGLPYCERDWNDLFTTKCFACGFPVEAGDRWVEALNNNYHSQCFNCTMCKKNLEGQSFYAKGGRPFCKNHAR